MTCGECLHRAHPDRPCAWFRLGRGYPLIIADYCTCSGRTPTTVVTA